MLIIGLKMRNNLENDLPHPLDGRTKDNNVKVTIDILHTHLKLRMN